MQIINALNCKIQATTCIKLVMAIFMVIWLQGMAHAQYQLGLRLERYAGIQSAAFNPAHTSLNPRSWDLGLVGFSLFFNTNYAFVRNAGLLRLATEPDRLRFITDTLGNGPRPISPDDMIIDNRHEPHESFGGGASRTDGPSFSFRFKENNTIGIYTALRAEGSGYNVPPEMSYFYLDAVFYDTLIPATEFYASGAVFGEVGLNYSKVFTDYSYRYHTFGVNIKYLIGVQAGYAYSRDRINYIRSTKDTVSFTNGNWEYALTSDLTQDIDKLAEARPQKNGSGVGIDLGYSFSVPDEEADDDGAPHYIMNFSVAVLDIGSINYNKNSEVHKLKFNTFQTVNVPEFYDLKSSTAVSRLLSQFILNDSLASLAADNFTIGLPTAITLRGDYKIKPNLYCSAVVVQRTPVFKNSIKRANVLAIVPRLEHRSWSVSMPLVMSNYDRVHLGLAARLGPLTLGTDNLNSMFRQKKFTGTDLYFGLKINGFNTGLKKKFKRGKKHTIWHKTGCHV